MRLLTGPAGSGKTTTILDECRAALRAGDDAVRLLVPTATLAQHLQNHLAREGFVFRRGLIQTLSAFIGPWVEREPQVPDTVFYLIVEAAVKAVQRPEFAAVAELPGFCAAMARTISELSSAGCDSTRLAANLPTAPLAAAFLAIHREVDRELARRGYAMRARRLELAAERILLGGLPGIHKIWLDGFHALPDPELSVIAALGRHAEVTLTLNDSDATDRTRARLRSLGFESQLTSRSRANPAVAVVKAPSIEREVEEIARRILDQASAGRPFREIAIIVRSADTYVPLLRAALERFQIPARFYFDSKLDEHAAIRFLSGALDAMLGGWDHQPTLAAIRLAPRLADSSALDRFDFAVREQFPNRGLQPLRDLAGDSKSADYLQKLLNEFEALDALPALQLTPKDWAIRFQTLRNLFRPARPHAAANHEAALAYRSQATALDLFDEAVDEAAQALEPARTVALDNFWRTVKSSLRLKPLRFADRRRDVVHVLSAPEARQWVLPIVFVCGMVEKQFPQLHRQDAFFPDIARQHWNAAGIRVRTAAEFEREERALFDAAITRATMLVTLSYPEYNAAGENNLPSIFLEEFATAPQSSALVRPRPSREAVARPFGPIQAAPLLQFLRERTTKLSPSGLESYLQCAFQYFGGRMLRLESGPYRPEERLDFLLQGTLVHAVLAQWYVDRSQSIESLFEVAFEAQREQLRIPNSYQTERLRNGMLDDLRAFALDTAWSSEGLQSQTEIQIAFPLDDTAQISGRIDRIDTDAEGRAYILDYKYSAAAGTKGRLDNENLLQAPLYMMGAEALGVKPVGVFYVGLKGGIKYAGWSSTGILKSREMPNDWLGVARARTLEAMHQIRAGRVEPLPANPANCRFCDFRDVCRIANTRAGELEAASGEGA